MAAAVASAETEYPGVNPYLIAIIVSVATFMEVLDTTIANVALRYISGTLAIGPDEAAWVLTSYLVANSIVLCASSWFVQLFGRKRFFQGCVILFTISSACCGFAWSLQSLLFFRVLQGLAGGGMTPVAQSILAAAFPPAKRSQGFAIYGVAVVVAPVAGPALGGYLSDNFSWHWCFLINVPVGILSLISVALLLPETDKEKRQRKEATRGKISFDLVGFLLVATFLGALEVVLDRGQEDDWFASNFIIIFAVISLIALILFIPWELTRKEPLIDLRMLGSRQFGACFLIMLGTGAILIATTQILPQLLQTQFGYTATWAGVVISPGGIVTMFMFILVGRVGGYVDPKWLIVTGSLIMAAAVYQLTNLNGNLDFGFFAWSRVYLAFGLPLVFNAVTSASFNGVPPDKTDQASSLINVARNFGGSIGVSIAQTVLAQREQFHQSRLSEHVGAWNPMYGQTLQRVQNYFAANSLIDNGGSPAQSAAGWIAQQVRLQATYLAYIDVFAVLSLMALGLAFLAITLRSTKPGAAAAAA